jgi:hypothetical protein
MTKEDKKIEQTIEQLVANSTPVSSTSGPFCFIKKLLLGSIIYLSVCLFFYGFRYDLEVKLSEFSFIVELFLALLGSVIAAYGTAVLAVPDNYQRRWQSYWAVIPLLLLSCVLIYQEYTSRGGVVVSTQNTYACALDIVFFSLVPVLIAFFALKRSAPVYSIKAAFMAGLTAVYLAYIVLRLIEANDDIYHLFLWHLLPMAAVVVVCSYLGKRYLRW